MRIGSFIIGLIWAQLAMGQTTPTCTAYSSNVPTVRAEGRAEQLGQMVIDCFGFPETPTGSFDVQVWLNTPVTSRLINSTTQATEAMLLVNEPTPGSASPVCNVGEVCPEGTRVYQGRKLGVNSIVFPGVKVPGEPLLSGRASMRIVNLRADASSLPPPGPMPSSVQALIAVTPPNALNLANSVLVVGYGMSGLRWSLRKPDNTDVLPASGASLKQCVANNELLANNPATASAPQGPSFNIRLSENYPTAFLAQTVAVSGTASVRPTPAPQNSLIMIYNSESMYYHPGLPPGSGNMQTAGLATYATRFRIKFSGVPPGVAIHAPIYQRGKTETDSYIRLLSAGQPEDSANYVPATPSSSALQTYWTKDHTYLYEVTTVSGGPPPVSLESIDLPFYIAHTGKPYVGAGQIQATVSFAPTFNPDQEPSTSVPRFVPNTELRTVATVESCPAVPVLSASVTGKTGSQNSRLWSVTLKNTGTGGAQNARVDSFALQQTYGAACTPVVTSAMPVAAGNIPAAGSATAPVTIDFTGCAAAARFKATIGFGADNAPAGVLTLYNQFR